jgi:hypothetical protein
MLYMQELASLRDQLLESQTELSDITTGYMLESTLDNLNSMADSYSKYYIQGIVVEDYSV